MATRIPLPDNNRSGLFEGLMAGHKTRHARDQLQQQANQFDKKLEFSEKQLSQAWRQHEQNLALHQQQEKRLAEAAQLSAKLHPLQVAQLRASIGAHQAKTKQLQQKQTMLEKMLNGTFGQQSGSGMQEMPEGETAQPSSMGEGMQPSAPPPMDVVKNGFKNLTGPQAAFVKKETGFDPFAESPQEKDARTFNQKVKFEEYKQNKDLEKPTPAVVTQNQNIVAAINNLRPQIEYLKLLKTPNLATGEWTDPDTTATYEGAIGSTVDSLMAAFKFLGIEASVDQAKAMVMRRVRESDANYHKRLDKLDDELVERQNNAYSIYTGKKVRPNSKSGPSEGTPTKIVNGKEYDMNSSESNDPFGLRKSK